MIRGVIFDYGDTLVVTNEKNDLIIRRALKAPFDVFKAQGLGLDYADFVEGPEFDFLA